jgi:putative oxidoreductase
MTTTTMMNNVRPATRPGRLGRLFGLHESAGRALETLVEPLFNLGLRLWVGWTFFTAGMARVTGWSGQDYLFSEVHPLPVLPPKIWAGITTATELVLPVLLALGLFTRVPALGLLIMSMVIQFVLGDATVGESLKGDPIKISHAIHYSWMIAMGYVAIRGGSTLSLDRFLKR